VHILIFSISKLYCIVIVNIIVAADNELRKNSINRNDASCIWAQASDTGEVEPIPWFREIVQRP
jgi:hypothetical protein